ncbi:MAG: tRNA (N(6)-L-threonylcarbamoyladenosine(37)-C(2))-methylthiotransferase MtaB [Clostridia bacterium]|nr:tRNA (N(6)-L-threonylcarbamoyladenosine(37)-C(2))-methylthiotransferase MtaB [Clostridia bacterium]
MKVSFYALGCKVNQYEIDCYAKIFSDSGWEIGNFSEKCDAYVINTCAITNIGERKSRQIIRRAKKQNPDAVVAVTGCYAQTKAEEVKNMSEADVVLGTANRAHICRIVEAKIKGEDIDLLCDIMRERDYEELECEGRCERTRAYIKIQDGCDNFCSYCIVPYARGPVRSRSLENIIPEAKRLAEAGFREIVLTGISVASYGKDLKDGNTLKNVIKEVCKVEGIERVRLSSISPNIFNNEFIDFIANEKKMCRHFHISLQSGSTSVLKRMNRKYSAEEYLDTLERIRAAMPDCGITTDIICGFPEESDEEFLETMEFVKKAHFLKVHVFPYSERSGTVAARMEQIPHSIREERAAKLTTLTEEIAKEVEKSFIGQSLAVLFEQTEGEYIQGLAGNYLRIYAKGGEDLTGEIRSVKITEYKDGKIYGEIIK